MGDQPPPPPSLPRSNMPMLYYGLVVVGTAAVVLALYNLIIVRWCAQISDPRSRQRGSGPAQGWRGRRPYVLSSVSSFKYEKERGVGEVPECVVCLSAFEEGEEVRLLPKCNHSFHAPCIDMWLYTHIDCPLCRCPVEPPADRQREVEQPHQGLLLGRGNMV